MSPRSWVHCEVAWHVAMTRARAVRDPSTLWVGTAGRGWHEEAVEGVRAAARNDGEIALVETPPGPVDERRREVVDALAMEALLGDPAQAYRLCTGDDEEADTRWEKAWEDGPGIGRHGVWMVDHGPKGWWERWSRGRSTMYAFSGWGLTIVQVGAMDMAYAMAAQGQRYGPGGRPDPGIGVAVLTS